MIHDPSVQDALDLEDARFTAMSTSDLETLEALLADDLHYVHANGMVEDKTEFLRKIASGERKYLRFAALDREARREGEFVFVFGRAEVEVERAAGFLKSTLTYTAVYRRNPSTQFFIWHAVKALDG